MRTDTALFTTKNVQLAKRPRYVIELAFDSANQTLWYFTSHTGTALPGGASAVQGVIEGLSGTSQKLNPDVANASIGNISFRLVDKASIVTSTLGTQLVLGRSTRRQRVRVYVGFEDLAWADFTLVQTQLVTKIAYEEGAYVFTCADVQREMRKDLFEIAKTTLAQSLSADATTIEVVSTAAFQTLAHGSSYSDAPNSTVGYVKVQDEVIRYTSKTATQFILGAGGQRGALNTRAVEHAVDLTAAADRRTAVEEYIYLEMPAVKLTYALLTGKIVGPALDFDFTKDSIASLTGISPITFTRAAATASRVNSVADLETNLAADTPRFDYEPSGLPNQQPIATPRGLLVEETRTNGIRNNVAAGAVPGTPGTPPTNWGMGTTHAELVMEIISSGVDDGISYLDIRLSGTMTASRRMDLAFEPNNIIAAAVGQRWAESVYFRVVGGSLTNITLVTLQCNAYTSGGVFTELPIQASALPITAAALITQRKSASGSLAVGTTAFIQPYVTISTATSGAVDVTLRIGMPQLEHCAVGGNATSVIRTAGTATARNFDRPRIATMSSYPVPEGTLYSEWVALDDPTGVNALIACIGDGTGNNFIRTYIDHSSDLVFISVVSGGATQALFSAGPHLAGQVNRLALRWKNNFVGASLNAGAEVTDTVATIPGGLTQWDFGHQNGVNFLNGYMRRSTLYQVFLASEDLIDMSAGGDPAAYANGAELPTTWHLGIPTSYVRLSDFTGIGKDLWEPADDTQGFNVRFEGLEKTDGKKFIESELALLVGVFMPIYADGALGLRRMANVLAGASYVRLLDETNLVRVGDLVHDFEALHNVMQISWNWEPARKELTRVNVLIDAASATIHGRADPLKLKFRGLHGSRHSSIILAQRFDSLRDRYTGPPLRADVQVMPSLNTLEVGDVVRLRPSGVRDFVVNTELDRSFEIQNITMDWVNGDVTLQLFASSQAPAAIAASPDATVLSDAWYSSQGTALSSVVTITGSNPGHVTVGGTLTGNADMNTPGAIFYYSGDLVIDPGVTINVTNNVQLRIKGFLTNNGTINGKGAGLTGGAAGNGTAGTAGFIGTTEAGGGLALERRGLFGAELFAVRAPTTVGQNATVSSFQLVWDGTTLSGLPTDQRGTSGGGGVQSANWIGAIPGGAGGNGGAGLRIICRGFAQGVAAKIDLSGGNGSLGSFTDFLGARFHAGSGAGGAPGALIVLLDGALIAATGLTESGFVANHGTTPIQGGQMPEPTRGGLHILSFPKENFYSYYVGTGDGTTFDLPSLSGARGGSRVQYVPGTDEPEGDSAAATLSPPTNVGLASGTNELLIQSDGTVLPRIKVTWTPSLDARTVAYELQFKPSSVTVWSSAPIIFGQASNTAWIIGVRDGIEYDVRLRAAGATREVSDWITIFNYVVIGKTDKPGNVGTLSFTDPILSWPILTDADLRGYVVRYQPGANTDWATATPAHKAGFITEALFDTGDIVGGSTTLLVKGVDTSGNESTLVSSLLVDLRPVTPTSFTISRQPDGTREFNWSTLVPPADLDGVLIRYFLGTTSDWVVMTPLHNGVLKAAPFESNQLAAGVYTFAAKNIDRAQNESATPIFITTVTLGDPRIAGAIEDFREEPYWMGTKIDCHVD